MNPYDPSQDQRSQLLKQLAGLGGASMGAASPQTPQMPAPPAPAAPLPQPGPQGPGLGGIMPPAGGALPPLPGMGAPAPVAPPMAAPPALGAPPPGFDAGKWADPNKHDPKYDIGRLLQGAAGPNGLDSAGVQGQLDAINKLYPGTTFDGRDVINIPGFGPIDVIQGLGTGHGTTAWQPVGQGGQSGGGGKSMPNAALQSLVGGGGGLTGGLAGALSGGDVTAQILAEINGLMGGNGSSLTRDALLNKLGVQSPSSSGGQ